MDSYFKSKICNGRSSKVGKGIYKKYKKTLSFYVGRYAAKHFRDAGKIFQKMESIGGNGGVCTFFQYFTVICNLLPNVRYCKSLYFCVYRKKPKNLDTRQICCNYPKSWTVSFYDRVMHPKDAGTQKMQTEWQTV